MRRGSHLSGSPRPSVCTCGSFRMWPAQPHTQSSNYENPESLVVLIELPERMRTEHIVPNVVGDIKVPLTDVGDMT
jgi:hypothetical protein